MATLQWVSISTLESHAHSNTSASLYAPFYIIYNGGNVACE